MSLNFCDLLVLGSDLSGVMAATLLAKRGMNVLLIDDGSDEETLPNLVTGLSSKNFKSFLGKLMIPDSKLQALHENKIPGQIIFPKHRLDLHPSRPTFLKEIQREFPKEREILEQLFEEVERLRETHLEEALQFFPIVGGKQKKQFIKWFQSLPQEKILDLWQQISPTAQCFLRVYLKFQSRSLLIEPLILQLLFFLHPDGAKTFSIKGGLRELKKIFFDKLDYFGGMIHPLEGDTFQVLTKGREVRGIQLGRYNFPTRCRYFIGNGDIKQLYENVSVPFFLFPFFQKKKVLSLPLKECRSSIRYQLSREIIPTPMKENVIFVANPDSPLSGSNYLEINFCPLSGSRENGYDTELTVTYGLPEENTSSIKAKELFDEIDKAIRKLIPFSEGHLSKIEAHQKKSQNSQEELPLFPTSPLEDTQVLLEKGHSSFYSSSLFFPTPKTPYKNFFTLGPNMLDWLGMEGKILTALRVVDLIWSHESKLKSS